MSQRVYARPASINDAFAPTGQLLVSTNNAIIGFVGPGHAGEQPNSPPWNGRTCHWQHHEQCVLTESAESCLVMLPCVIHELVTHDSIRWSLSFMN